MYEPVHRLPSPSYPLIQRQTYDPSVLVHKAFRSHSFASSAAHSSTSRERTKQIILRKGKLSSFKRAFLKQSHCLLTSNSFQRRETTGEQCPLQTNSRGLFLAETNSTKTCFSFKEVLTDYSN